MEKIYNVPEQNRNCFDHPEEHNAAALRDLLEARVDSADSEIGDLEKTRDEDLKEEMDRIKEDMRRSRKNERIYLELIVKEAGKRKRNQGTLDELYKMLDMYRREQANIETQRKPNARTDYERYTLEIQEIEHCRRQLIRRRRNMSKFIEISNAAWRYFRRLRGADLEFAMINAPSQMFIIQKKPNRFRPFVRPLRQIYPPPIEVTVKFAGDQFCSVTQKAIHYDLVAGNGFTVAATEEDVPETERPIKPRNISLIVDCEDLNNQKATETKQLTEETRIIKLEVTCEPNQCLNDFVESRMIKKLVFQNSCVIPAHLSFRTLQSLTTTEFNSITAENLMFLYTNKELNILNLSLQNERQERGVQTMIQEWVTGERKIERWVLSKSTFLFASEEPIRRPNIDGNFLEVKVYPNLGKKTLTMIRERDLQVEVEAEAEVEAEEA